MTASSTFTATDGVAYERQMGRWSRVGWRCPSSTFAGPVGAERILDLGCGTGSLTREFARRQPGSRITGLDFSPAYVAGMRAGGSTIHGSGSRWAMPVASPFADASSTACCRS